MGRVVLDSSVLIAMFYDGDVHFDAVANKLRDEENTYMISTISLAETLTHASGKGSRQIELIVSRIQGAMTEIVEVDQEIAIAAAKIREKTKVKIPEAIISATATLAGAELWTLDARLAKAHKGAVLIA
jgi:predicted nucleic acid-binding protein